MKPLRRKTKKEKPIEAQVEENAAESSEDSSSKGKKPAQNKGPQNNKGPQGGKFQKAKNSFAGGKSIGRRSKV